MPVSCIIPILNEDIGELNYVIFNLTEGLRSSDVELIIVNDGSVNDDGTAKRILKKDILWPNTKIINSKERFGVGYSFDRGVSEASGDTIVLMGSDVYPEPRKWLQTVLNSVKEGEIGCACSVGMQNGVKSINPDSLYSRYGAKIIYKLTVDDLPKNSEFRKYPDYRDILEAKWLPAQPYEIPCPYGAFYFLTKEFYERIHGFDTIEGEHLKGHCYWGALEPFLAIKMKVYGGKCLMYPDMRAGHVFSRVDVNNPKRSIRDDLKWFNKLWILHTMFEDDYRDELLAWPHHSLNLSQARVYIKENWDYIQEIRERNRREGKLISKT
jgi:glycosyltransferase involved in cell wall biosynthesis